MRLKIVRAENLPAGDATGKSDPFVKISYDGRDVGVTPRVKRTLNPRWDFEVSLPPLAHAGALYVVLEVWDKDDLSANDLLGALRVPFPDWRDLAADYQARQQQQAQQQQQQARPPPVLLLQHHDTVALGDGAAASRQLKQLELQRRSKSLNSSQARRPGEAVASPSPAHHRASIASTVASSVAEGGEPADGGPSRIKPVLVWCNLVKGPLAQGRLLCAVQYEERDLKALANQPYGTNVQEVFLPQNPRFAQTYCHLPRSWHPDLAVRQQELSALHAGAPKDCLFPWNEKILYMVEEVTVTFHVNESNQGVLATLVLTNYRIWFVPYRRVRGLLHEDVHTLPIGKVSKASIVQQKRSNNNTVTVLVLDNMDAGHYHVTLSPIARLRDSVRENFAREAEAKRIKQVHNIVAEIEWLRLENSFCSPADLNHAVATPEEMQLEDDLRLYTPKHSDSGTGGGSIVPTTSGPSLAVVVSSGVVRPVPVPPLARAMTTQLVRTGDTSAGFPWGVEAAKRDSPPARPKLQHHTSAAATFNSHNSDAAAGSVINAPHHPPAAGKRRIRYDAAAEYRRQGAWTHPRWRYCSLNEQYQLCSTYPSFLMVPAGLSNDTIHEAAQYRSKNRFPALSWIHPRTGAPLCRSSQPNTGVLRSMNQHDRDLIWAIRDAAIPAELALTARKPSKGMPKKSSVLHIVDARPEINAKSNALAGKGHESVKQYDRDGVPMAVITFMGIDNIHVVRSSLAGLAQALYEVDDSNFFGSVQKSRWLEHICSILQGATEVANHLERGDAVLVHCSDGWDRTAQLSALAQLMLDPYYRTLEGFAVIIEKDWCSFGHMFQKRCGHPTSDNTSPVFLQFLDAVYQLMVQFPTHFQFNELFLSYLAEAVYSSWYGTFQKNSERERRVFLANIPSVSLWDVIRASTDEFLNPLFAGSEQSNARGGPSSMEPMIPVCRVRVMQLWVSQYQKAIGHMRLQQREYEMLQLIRQQETELSQLYALLTRNQHLELRALQVRSDIASLARSMNLEYPDVDEKMALTSQFDGTAKSKQLNGDLDKPDFHSSSGGASRKRVTAASVDFNEMTSLSSSAPATAPAAIGPAASNSTLTMAQRLQRVNNSEAAAAATAAATVAAAAAASASSPPAASSEQQQSTQHQNVPNPRRRRSLTSRTRANSLRATTTNIMNAMTMIAGMHDKNGEQTKSNETTATERDGGAEMRSGVSVLSSSASASSMSGYTSPPKQPRIKQQQQQYQVQHDELKHQVQGLDRLLEKLNNQIELKEDAAKQIMRRFRCYNYNLPTSVAMNDEDAMSPNHSRVTRTVAGNSTGTGANSGSTQSKPAGTSSFRQSGNKGERFQYSWSVLSPDSSPSSRDSSPSPSAVTPDSSSEHFMAGSAPLLTTTQVISSSNYLNSQPVWERDEDAPCCKRCKKKFKTLFRNRHHCRCCGYVFCGRCTSHRMSLPDFGYYDVVRVCKVCYNSDADG